MMWTLLFFVAFVPSARGQIGDKVQARCRQGRSFRFHFSPYACVYVLCLSKRCAIRQNTLIRIYHVKFYRITFSTTLKTTTENKHKMPLTNPGVEQTHKEHAWRRYLFIPIQNLTKRKVVSTTTYVSLLQLLGRYAATASEVLWWQDPPYNVDK